MVNVPMMEFGGVYISRELGERVVVLIQQNNKMEAIRILREEAGLDLKTAKEAVDSYSNNIFELKTIIKTIKERKGGNGSPRAGKFIVIIILIVLLGFIFKDWTVDKIENELFRTISYKPVIYLYPEEMDV